MTNLGLKTLNVVPCYCHHNDVRGAEYHQSQHLPHPVVHHWLTHVLAEIFLPTVCATVQYGRALFPRASTNSLRHSIAFLHLTQHSPRDRLQSLCVATTSNHRTICCSAYKLSLQNFHTTHVRL
ncbi:hypothetical protein TNCV_176301 [Trichonephila clavipes]|nr:hypothetical protein TNCV_176301 [Trichonephila clavipes]